MREKHEQLIHFLPLHHFLEKKYAEDSCGISLIV